MRLNCVATHAPSRWPDGVSRRYGSTCAERTVSSPRPHSARSHAAARMLRRAPDPLIFGSELLCVPLGFSRFIALDLLDLEPGAAGLRTARGARFCFQIIRQCCLRDVALPTTGPARHAAPTIGHQF